MKALGQLSAVFFQPSALGALALAPGDEWVTEPQCRGGTTCILGGSSWQDVH